MPIYISRNTRVSSENKAQLHKLTAKHQHTEVPRLLIHCVVSQDRRNCINTLLWHLFENSVSRLTDTRPQDEFVLTNRMLLDMRNWAASQLELF
jgi:hypothetical protein